MALRSAFSVTLSPEQKTALERLHRAHHTPQQLALRAWIILLAGDGKGVRETARIVAVEPKTVRVWRRRWLAAKDAASVARFGDMLSAHRNAGGMVITATHLPLPLPGATELRLG